MVRRWLAVAVMLAACGLGLTQEKKPNPDDPKAAEREKAIQQERAERRAKYFKANPTELPELVEKLSDKPSLPTVAEEKSDTPITRTGKRIINAETTRHELIWTRIHASAFTGSTQFTQLSECVFGQYAAAATIWDDPETLLPYAEAAVVALMSAEEFTAPRVAQGVEESQLQPQLQAARYRAEVTVLKLREQVKAKKK